MPLSNPLENEFKQVLEREADCYTEALALTKELPARFAAGEDTVTAMQRLDDLLHEIAKDHAKLKDIKARWDAAGYQPTTEISRAWDRLRQQVGSLQVSVMEAVNAATLRQQKLKPQLTSEVITNRMRAAYRNSVTAR